MDHYSELVTRTSWVDANLAYHQIEKGNARGNKAALTVRGHTQTYLYNLGCFVDRNSWKVLLIGCLTLSLLCIGLQSFKIQTSVDRLWVSEEGRLKNELQYTKSILGEGSGTTSSIILQTAKENNLLSRKSLLQHYKVIQAATDIRIKMFARTWKFTDLCYKPAFPSFEESLVDRMIDELLPCTIITPLDCFWEGSKLLGPDHGIRFKGFSTRLKWTNLNPQQLVKDLENISAHNAASHLQKVLERGGITTGYQYRPCLDPEDKECPRTSPNFQSKKVPDIGSTLTGGCVGFSGRYMRWNEDLIIGNADKNKTGHIFRAKALQSIVQLMGERDMYLYYKDTFKVHNMVWTEEKAKRILTAWQRKFVEITTELAVNNSSQIFSFSGVTMDDLIADFSAFSTPKIILGSILLIMYTCLSMLRWSDCVSSQAGLGMAGILLMILSNAAGMGASAAIGVQFNAASTQIIPFLSLGLSANNVFLMLSVLSERIKQKDLPLQDVTGGLLRSTGVNILMTSLCTAAVTFLAALIPIPALRAFSIQTAIIVLMNLISILVIYPSIISLDIRRRKLNRIDVFCCFRATVNTVQELRPDAFQQMSHDQPAQRALCTYTQGSKDPYKTALSPSGQLTTDVLNLEGNLRSQTSNISGLNALRNSKFQVEKPVFSRLPPNMTALSSQRRVDVADRREDNINPIVDKHDKAAWSIDGLVSRFYIPLIHKPLFKIIVLMGTILSVVLGSWYVSRVEDGLMLTDIIPKETTQYNFFYNEAKYFGYYNFHAVTKGDVDYPSEQSLLYEYHQSFRTVDHIMKKKDGTLPDFWLILFRNWLLDLQKAFDSDVSRRAINDRGWEYNATDEGILAYKLLVQTGDIDRPIDKEKVLTNRLVKDGIINPDGFYNYLSAWVSNDAMAYDSSEALLHPQPAFWIHVAHDYELIVPKSKPIVFAQLPFHLIHLHQTKTIISVVKQEIRTICDSFRQKGLDNYPVGVPFTFWEQYLDIRLYLATALVCSLICVFMILALFFCSFWAAMMVVIILTLMIVDVFGFMGLIGLRLSAIPAVIIVLVVGVGIHFTVHIMICFVTAVGTREERVSVAVSCMSRPIIHGAVSTFLGIFMLAFSEFQFVFSYFFLVLGFLMMVGLVAGLIVLPVGLTLIGPSAEVIPTDVSVYMLALKVKPEPRKGKRPGRPTFPARNLNPSLSTITEEPSRLQSSHEIIVEPNVVVESSSSNGNETPPTNSNSSFRPVTTTVRAETRVTVEVYNPYHLPGQMQS